MLALALALPSTNPNPKLPLPHDPNQVGTALVCAARLIMCCGGTRMDLILCGGGDESARVAPIAEYVV